MRTFALILFVVLLLGPCTSLANETQSLRADQLPFERSPNVILEVGPTRAHGVVLFVRFEGDAQDQGRAWLRHLDASDNPFAWLRATFHVRVVESKDGLPVYLTTRPLAIPRPIAGIQYAGYLAAQLGQSTSSCVVAHEILHEFGLQHVPDELNVMAPSCAGPVDSLAVTPEQLAFVDQYAGLKIGGPDGNAHRWVAEDPEFSGAFDARLHDGPENLGPHE